MSWVEMGFHMKSTKMRRLMGRARASLSPCLQTTARAVFISYKTEVVAHLMIVMCVWIWIWMCVMRKKTPLVCNGIFIHRQKTHTHSLPHSQDLGLGHRQIPTSQKEAYTFCIFNNSTNLRYFQIILKRFLWVSNNELTKPSQTGATTKQCWRDWDFDAQIRQFCRCHCSWQRSMMRFVWDAYPEKKKTAKNGHFLVDL